MKWSVDLEVFAPVWAAVRPKTPPSNDPLSRFDAAEVDGYCTALIRIEADHGRVRFSSPFGDAEIPAQVERRGVLFLPFRDFDELMEPASGFYGDTVVRFEASNDRIVNNYARFLSARWQWELFDDPGTAPQTWQPPARPPEVDEWGGVDGPDDADQAQAGGGDDDDDAPVTPADSPEVAPRLP